MSLVKLTKAEVLGLQANDDTVYRVKLIRLTMPQPMLVAEIDSTLHVQRTPGKKSTLALVVPTAINWAEGGADAVGEDGAVVVEDYHMEIYRQTRETVTTELVKRRRRS